MQLTINGERRTMNPVRTVAELLVQLELDPRAVVVERNRDIVRRADVSTAPVADGDVLEIVHFVGGG